MASIKVTTQMLTSTAQDIRSINTKLDQDLASINTEMDNLGDTWQSDAGTEIRSKMNGMKPRFEEYKTVVESYAKFLDTTAQSYETTEQTAQSNAAQFK
jgi:WXG100 family type VII secretion target